MKENIFQQASLRYRRNRGARAFFLTLFLVLLMVVTTGYIEYIVTEYIQIPILSHIDFREDSVKICYLLIWFIFLISFLSVPEIFRDDVEGNFWSFVGIYYLLYRCGITGHLQPTFISFLKIDSFEITYLDFCLLPFCIIIVQSFFSKVFENSKRSKFDTSFKPEEPLNFDFQADLHDREGLLSEVVERIRATTNRNSSFAISITAPWGHGKTTFINNLVRMMQRGEYLNEFIVIQFNPWLNDSLKSISDGFFDEFAIELGNYTNMSTWRIKRLFRYHLDQKNISFVSLINSFMNVTAIAQTRTQQREELVLKIRGIGKKLVVFIDDLDRLMPNEIREVMKIVRNSANFPNVFFVVAFDRKQVVRAFEEQYKEDASKYIEKIFQFELELTPLNKRRLAIEFEFELGYQMNEREKAVLQAFMIGKYWHNDFLNRFDLYISSHRDIIRFRNLFFFVYQLVKGEVDLVDFLLLMVLKYTAPDFVAVLYDTPLSFVNEIAGDSGYSSKQIVYVFDEEKFNSYLRAQEGEKLNGTDDYSKIKIILSCLFPVRHRQPLDDRIGVIRSMNIRNKETFKRYFEYNLKSELSFDQFNTMFILPIGEYLDALADWVHKDVTKIRWVYTILVEYEAMVSFDVFDKVVKSLLLLSKIEHNIADRHNLPVIKAKDFIEKFFIGNPNEIISGNVYPIERIFGGVKKIKKYVSEICKDAPHNHELWIEIARLLNESGGFSWENVAIDKDDLEAYLVRTLEYRIENEQDMTWDLLKLADFTRQFTGWIPADFSLAIKGRFCESFLTLMIVECHEHSLTTGYRTYYIHEFVDFLDEKQQGLIEFIARSPLLSNGFKEEYTEFCGLLSSHNEHCVCYEFNYVRIQSKS